MFSGIKSRDYHDYGETCHILLSGERERQTLRCSGEKLFGGVEYSLMLIMVVRR
jgi:hypothetical protein